MKRNSRSSKDVGQLSKLFKQAETRRRNIKQTMEHQKKKITNGGRNTDQTRTRFENALEDLEKVQVEYTSIASALQEAQSYLEGSNKVYLGRLADLQLFQKRCKQVRQSRVRH